MHSSAFACTVSVTDHGRHEVFRCRNVFFRTTPKTPIKRTVTMSTGTPSVDRRVYTLLQLGRSLKRSIEAATADRRFWVKGEVVNYRESGHAYLELVQHEQGARVAVMRGIIWRSDLVRIIQELGDEARNILVPGSEILFRARVLYHEVYGLSLQVEEIDLSFTLGELERKKRATVETLRKEGLLERNKMLPEPLVVQRIALISSFGTAAHADFMKHLERNEYGYRFHVHLFNSSVQGEGAAPAIRNALKSIDTRQFDAVVIIRGGGSRLDLEAFNDLDLCRTVACMPIPVMTGIGHEIDVSVVDLIAHGAHKTPTAIADRLLDKSLYFETQLSGFLVNIHRIVQDRAATNKERLALRMEQVRTRPVRMCEQHWSAMHMLAGQLQRRVTGKLTAAQRDLQMHTAQLGTLPLRKVRDTAAAQVAGLAASLSSAAQQRMHLMLGQLHGIQDTVRLMAPERTLARGFTISRQNGRCVTNANTLSPGDVIETTFAHGRTWSTISTIEADGAGTADV
jgi:exodeoxyribonuclease VII large subunit